MRRGTSEGPVTANRATGSWSLRSGLYDLVGEGNMCAFDRLLGAHVEARGLPSDRPEIGCASMRAFNLANSNNLARRDSSFLA